MFFSTPTLVLLLISPGSAIGIRQTSVCRPLTAAASLEIKRQTDEVYRTNQPLPQSVRIESSFDPAKNLTTVRLGPVQISGPKDKYHSLHFAASYSYPGRVPEKPQVIAFELKSVVKARKLKIDLYVVFVVDGESIFLSSSRSAIRNPVPGRRWVGERLVFRMPYEVLLKIAKAKQVEIRMDAVGFEVGEGALQALREFARRTILH